MLKTGIVGLPNVGKSTLFNAVTRTRKAQAANFPFCTIEPNVGIVNVPDDRLQKLAAMSKSEKILPAAIEFVDIAGLVAGASEGEGLGNQFVCDGDSAAAKHVAAVREYAAKNLGSEAVVISAQIESELADLPPEEALEFLSGLGVSDSGVSQLIRGAYHLLGLRTYLTTGPKETRAWTINAGDKAPAAAGVIHSDFERGFIAAQIVSFDDLMTLGSEAKAKEAGKLRLEGKEYVVQDGDVVEFRFNV